MGYEERVTEINIFDFGGLDTRSNELTIPDNSSPDMNNVDLHPVGAMKKRQGYTIKTSPGGTGEIAGLISLVRPDQGDGFVYCIQGDTVYRLNDPGAWQVWSDISSPTGINVTDGLRWRGEMARYTGEDSPCVYLPRIDGAPLILKGEATLNNDMRLMVAGAYGTGAPGTGTAGYGTDWGSDHWPTGMRLIGQGRGERLYAWGFADDPNLVAYSEMRVPWNFLRKDVDDQAAAEQPTVDGGEFYTTPGDGDHITGVVDMFNYVVVFKRHKTVVWYGDPGDDGFVIKHVFPVGCVNDRAWEKIGNDIIFWADDGPHTLSAVQEYGDLAQANIAHRIIADVTGIAPGQYDNIVSYHDHENLRVIWHVPTLGSDHNDKAFQYYYDKPRWAPLSGVMSEIPCVLKINSTSDESYRILAGTYDGGIVQLLSGATDGAQAIESDYTTKWFHVGNLVDGVRTLWLEVLVGDEGGRGLEIYYQADFGGEWIKIDRVMRSSGTQGARYGSFVYGGAAYGNTGRAMIRYEFECHARLLRFKFIDNSYTGFELLAIRFEARRKGARL